MAFHSVETGEAVGNPLQVLGAFGTIRALALRSGRKRVALLAGQSAWIFDLWTGKLRDAVI